jgi:DNA repair protein RadD
MKLRSYQIDALNKIDSDLKKSNEPILLNAITGSGKTVILVRLVNKYFKNSNKRFLILMHKQELIKQFYDTFHKMSDIPISEVGIDCSSLNSKSINKRVTIATIQTFFNQVDRYKYCDLLIIDECHKVEIGNGSQYDTIINKLYEKNTRLRIIGCTSTPHRLGHGYIYGKYCSGKNLFPECNHKITYRELKDAGFLMPLEGKVSIGKDFNNDLKNVNTTGDYVLDQLGDMMTKQVHLQTAVDAIEKYCKNFKHICVFCCTIEHAKKLQELLGEECTIVHSQLTDFERQYNMDQWRDGKKRIITSVNILVEGFDFPPLDCLVMARPTLSTALFLQAVGRVLRISDGKERAFLLDLTGNTEYFGTDLDNVEVNIPKKVGELIKKERQFEKDCPECGSICHKVCLECPECGYEWPMVEYEEANPPKLKDVQFEQEPPEEWKIDRIEWKRHKKKDKPDSVRIDYFSNDSVKYNSWGTMIPLASDWLCFDHGGYATQKAQAWWKKMHVSEIPENVDTALEILDRGIGLAKPSAVIIQKDGNFKRIVEYLFGDDLNIDNGNDSFYDDDIPF